MKKSYKKLIIFDIILAIILILNSFILNILGNYYYMCIFLVLLLIIFKLVFGLEKDRYRYTKDVIINMIIVLLISFIIYYIFGIFIGFYRPANFLTFYGIRTFIIPFTIMIVLREYLRVQMLNKADNSKVLTVATFALFVLLEMSPSIYTSSLTSDYNIFLFIALTILPVISNNVVCTYIGKKVGYKPNIFWLLVTSMYVVFLPIVPNGGYYITALIEFLFPFVLMYNTHVFYRKRENNVPISYMKKRVYIEVPVLAAIVFGLAYFVSGYFRFYAISIATGSMTPNILVGDVVIVDQHKDYKELKKGEIIAYKYDKVVVVHRICDMVVIGDDYYFYTKGDANEKKDNYIIYPDMIIGKVNAKVPYIGLPTVWLKELFE